MSASAPASMGSTGHYEIYDEIASGGMATVHLGRVMGQVSFARTVAIKRLHPHLAREPEVLAMFLDEARMAAYVRHPNVIPTLDIVTTQGSPFLVMEYIQGESLAGILGTLRANGQRISASIACAIAVGMLQGLHAAHETTADDGKPLGLVHRDVSPQNVMIGLDGIARLLDFGVAKAAGRLQTTREGQLKGKLAYMAPEILRGGRVTRAADVYSAAVLLWETLTGERLFAADNEGNVIERVLFAEIVAPSARRSDVPSALDGIVMRALSRDPAHRFATAREMARAIESAVAVARTSEVGGWVADVAVGALARRAQMVAAIESGVAHQASHSLDASADLPPYDAAPPSGAIVSKDIATSADASAARSRRRALWGVLGTATVAVALTIGLDRQRSASRTSNATGSTTSEPAAKPPALPPQAALSEPMPDLASLEAANRPAAPKLPAPARASISHSRPVLPAKGGARDSDVHEASAPPGASGARSKPASKSSCDPPWNVDPNGIKQYKLECL